MNSSASLPALLRQRTQLQQSLAQIGDFWQGSLSSQYRKCGKKGCHCAQPGDPGHGPSWILVRSVAGKPQSRSIPAAAVDQTRVQVEEYQRFRTLTRELAEVSSRICAERLKHGEPEIPEKKGRWSKRSKPRRSRN